MDPDAGAGSSFSEASSPHPGWPARTSSLRVPAGTVALRPLRFGDGRAWRAIRLRDREYLEPWEPSAPGSWSERHGLAGWLAQWWSLRSQARRGQALPFAIIVDGSFAGQLTIGNVIRASLRSGWVGYWVSVSRTSGGAATAAVALAVDHAFGPAGLHRLEATVRPENAASVRVLGKAGFREEGLFRRYLRVQGSWRDHLCFAITAEEIGSGVVEQLVAGGRAARA